MLQADAHECLLHIELVRSFMSAALHRDTVSKCAVGGSRPDNTTSLASL